MHTHRNIKNEERTHLVSSDRKINYLPTKHWGSVWHWNSHCQKCKWSQELPLKFGRNISASIHPAKHAISKKLLTTYSHEATQNYDPQNDRKIQEKNNMGSRKF